MRFLPFLALLTPSLALAVPLSVTHTGRLLDSTGTALDGDHDLDIVLYDAPSGGTELWSDSFTGLAVSEGYFTVVLGSGEALGTEHFAGDAIYVGLSVDGGTELTPRLPVSSVPFALRADTAVNVVGGVVDVTEVRIDGQTVLDSNGVLDVTEVRIDGAAVLDGNGLSTAVSWDDLANVPADIGDGDSDTLRDVPSCGDGDVAIFSGGSWACTGTVGLDRLAVGTSEGTLAAGDHGHSLSELEGVVDLSQLPMGGSGSDGVAYADHSHSDPLKATDVSDTCDADSTDLHGTLRYASDVLSVCTETGWREVARGAAGGTSSSDAGLTCKTLLDDTSTLDSGMYWVDPDGDGGEAPFETYCDMETDGGGWTLAAYAHSGSTSTNSSNQNHRSLKCGGGNWAPESRSNQSAAVNAIALAQNSTEMAISMNTTGSAVATGTMNAYTVAYAIEIPDPSKVTFINHSYLAGNRGNGDDKSGPCVQTAVRGIKGTTATVQRYLYQNTLGTSWTDSYPSGYGAASTSSCVNHDGYPFVTSIHTGDGHSATNGTMVAECDINRGSLNYNHRGNYAHTGTGTTGGNAIWFR